MLLTSSLGRSMQNLANTPEPRFHIKYICHTCIFVFCFGAYICFVRHTISAICWEGFHTNQISIDVAIVVAAVVAVVGVVAVLVVFVVVVVFVYNTHRFYLCCNGLSK